MFIWTPYMLETLNLACTLLVVTQILCSDQWRNANHVYHLASPAEIFEPLQSTIFLLSPKGRHYFFGFSYLSILRPLQVFGAPLELFVPQIFFLHQQTLIWPTYGTYLQPINLNLKFWCTLLMAHPGVAGAMLRHW